MTVTAMPPKKQDAGAEEPARNGKKKLLVAAALILALCAGGWWFFLKPAESTEPVPGEVMTLEATQLNLAGGHYLRLGIALQLTEDAHDVDGSKALDAAITLFSGRKVAEVSSTEQREELRAQLLEKLDEAYHGEVIDVYFREFVTQ